MKNKTIKKNNNPINITTKYNKKSKKKTNKKGKSNILKKTKKINRKNKKLLIGGEYNKNFFSVVLDDNFEKSIDENSFLYKFMEKYIKNLNKETDIPTEFVYKKYRNDYKTKDISNIKIQDLREIRLNYYLKSVMSIMKNISIPFNHSQITFENKPIDLHAKINEIKTNYDTNIESKLQEKDNKNTYFINCHGGYFKDNLKLFTVPDNVMIHFLTPLNYLSYQNNDEIKKLLEELTKILNNTIYNTIDNIKELLKFDCFQNMITFLPRQKCFDINLSIGPDDEKTFDNRMGIYNITSDNKPLKNIFNKDLSDLIPEIIPDIIPKRNSITNIYISSCRSCNNNLDNLTIETMYIYENFIKQLNNSLLDINNEPASIIICQKSFYRKNIFNPEQTDLLGRNNQLSFGTHIIKPHKIINIIDFYKKENPSIKEEQNINTLVNGTRFSDGDILYLVNYILSYPEKKSIIDFIYNKIKRDLIKNIFINDIYKKISSLINGQHEFDISGILKSFFEKYIDILINSNISLLPTVVIMNNNTEIVRLLLAHQNIDVNRKDKYGNTPLHLAVFVKNIEIVKLLLDNPNINVNIHNIQGNTPLQLAEMLNQPEIIELIKKHKPSSQ